MVCVSAKYYSIISVLQQNALTVMSIAGFYEKMPEFSKDSWRIRLNLLSNYASISLGLPNMEQGFESVLCA